MSEILINNGLLTLSNDFSLIFKNVDVDIKNELFKKALSTRKRQISFSDAFSYQLLYSLNGTTKQSVVSELCFVHNLNCSRPSFYNKSKKIPISFYENIYLKLRNLFLLKSNHINDLTLIAVDGTYNNTNDINCKDKNTLQTSLNLCLFDINNCIPIDITYYGCQNKNKEAILLKQLVDEKKIKNSVFVLDRAYYSFELIKSFIDNGLFFVIRIRNNYKIKNFEKLNKDNKLRFIKYKQPVSTIYKNKKDNDNEYLITYKNEFNLITNLNFKMFDDDKIKAIYNSRWDIEVFFNILKTNFKFEHLKEKNTSEEYKKLYLSILINYYIIALIEKVTFKTLKLNEEIISDKSNNKNKTNNKKNKNIKINKRNSIEGLKKIIYLLVHNKITYDKLYNFYKCYLVKITNNNNRKFKRISKTPFKKWYVKGYTEEYKFKKIIDSINKKEIKKLHKNLKLILKGIEIILINKEKEIKKNKIK